MWEEILKAIPVYFSCMLKFILGPIGGYASGLNMITTILTTVFGMMTVVFLFTYPGNWLKEKVLHRFVRNKNKSDARNKRFANIWKKYGLPGIALLTPIILTPIGGTLLAVSSGSPKEKIIFYMFISAAVWAVIFSMAIYFFGNEILYEWLPDFMKP
jgi:membrane protein DedA with SNARE-associated domain